MKNKDLSNAIGNINLKYVEEAENYTAKRMTLTKVISLAACIAILVAAIPATLILNREDVNTDAPVVTTPLEIENNDSENNPEKSPVKIIYCSSETAEEIRQAALENGVEIRDINTIDVDFSEKVIEKDVSADIPAKLYYTINGVEYVFEFCRARESSHSKFYSAESDKLYRSYAEYSAEKNDKRYLLDYYYETGEIRSLEWDSMSTKSPKGEFTLEEATAMSEKDMETYFGKDYADTYTLFYSKLIEVEHKDHAHYACLYVRYIGGYKTNESISISYNLQGDLISIYAGSKGRFDGLEDLDGKTIRRAEEEALKLIGECEVYDKYLTISNDGEVLLFIKYHWSDGHNGILVSLDNW